jgi:hypothetical protein
MTRDSRLTIVLAGMIAGDTHYGGATWAVLQYALGLRRLGHEVYFVEPIARTKLASGAALAASDSAQWFRRIVDEFGLSESATLLHEATRETVGLEYEQLQSIARRADVLLNISGMLTDRGLLEPIERRVYLDLDPGFNQAWHTAAGIDMRFDAHTHFATVGLAMGGPECRVPTCGKQWITTCPPVVLPAWPVATRQTTKAFTTVANWRSYGSLEYDGLFLGQKAHALRPLLDLPRRTRTPLTLALSIDPAEPDLARLRDNGWSLLDPRRAAGTPDSYQRFVAGSHAELGIAKSGYVVTRSGWFSDRSVCYLASGRPVLAQDTGFGVLLPTGSGLLSFTDTTDALAGVDAIEADYGRHRDAARALAEQHFDSDRVLTRLLDRVGAAA